MCMYNALMTEDYSEWLYNYSYKVYCHRVTKVDL